MKVYKNLIWFSALLIIAEGLILSGFEFIPINTKGSSRVLGESTSAWLEGIENQLFPASYYLVPSDDSLQTDNSLQNQEVKAVAQNDHVKKLDQSTDSGQTDLKQMIEFLNVPSDNELSIKTKQESSDSDTISTLINKNKRVYLKGLKKELDKISQGLDY
ncbi:MAG: hypothetical protein ABH896_01765 [Candidatus Jacksonbacteria bacterium]